MAVVHVQAQRFLALVLLPHVRHDIEENKRCHFALFQAMKKATYKPDAFFKVLLLRHLLSLCTAYRFDKSINGFAKVLLPFAPPLTLSVMLLSCMHTQCHQWLCRALSSFAFCCWSFSVACLIVSAFANSEIVPITRQPGSCRAQQLQSDVHTVNSYCDDTQCKHNLDSRTRPLVTNHCILTAVVPLHKDNLMWAQISSWWPKQSL